MLLPGGPRLEPLSSLLGPGCCCSACAYATSEGASAARSPNPFPRPCLQQRPAATCALPCSLRQTRNLPRQSTASWLLCSSDRVLPSSSPPSTCLLCIKGRWCPQPRTQGPARAQAGVFLPQRRGSPEYGRFELPRSGDSHMVAEGGAPGPAEQIGS